DWLREEILGGASLETLLAEAAAVPPGAEGLVFLPYLAGERSPIWDPSARGAFVGLTLGHRRGHLVRAVLEAAAFAIRHVAEPIVAAGIEVREMRVAGGPARSELWCRIKADATGFPVAVPEVFETALLGSAILAATGVGAYPDVAAAIERMVRVARRLEPDPAVRPTYDAAFGVYRALYPALKPLLARREAGGRIARATGGA
ncbi:MAG TPA: FGGY-family carbohydrate kinase, partial [Candidatus Limnocylindrales bacterium]|nr:FGGY-family carbohydrate kinase [Candidatus Limnocylindrales bacterium]